MPDDAAMTYEQIGRAIAAWMREVVAASDVMDEAEVDAVRAWTADGRRAVEVDISGGQFRILDYFTEELLASEPAETDLLTQESRLARPDWWSADAIADIHRNPCPATYEVEGARMELHAACDRVPYSWLGDLEPLECIEEWRAALVEIDAVNRKSLEGDSSRHSC